MSDNRHDARHPEISHAMTGVRWQAGGSAGRTIYAVFDDVTTEHARDRDSYLIGMFDTAELAAAAVDAHNAVLEFEAAKQSLRDGTIEQEALSSDELRQQFGAHDPARRP